MTAFFATLTYELHPSTEADAAKLLRAELVGRRWQDRWEGGRLPANTVWIRRSAGEDENVDHVQAACATDLHKAAAAVAATGRKIAVVRAWVHVSGGGTFGTVPASPPPPATPAG